MCQIRRGPIARKVFYADLSDPTFATCTCALAGSLSLDLPAGGRRGPSLDLSAKLVGSLSRLGRALTPPPRTPHLIRQDSCQARENSHPSGVESAGVLPTAFPQLAHRVGPGHSWRHMWHAEGRGSASTMHGVLGVWPSGSRGRGPEQARVLGKVPWPAHPSGSSGRAAWVKTVDLPRRKPVSTPPVYSQCACDGPTSSTHADQPAPTH